MSYHHVERRSPCFRRCHTLSLEYHSAVESMSEIADCDSFIVQWLLIWNSAWFNFLATSKQTNYFYIRWTRPGAFVFHSIDLVSVMYIRVVVRVRRGIDLRWSSWHVCRSHSCLIFGLDRILALFCLRWLSTVSFSDLTIARVVTQSTDPHRFEGVKSFSSPVTRQKVCSQHCVQEIPLLVSLEVIYCLRSR